MGFTATCPTRRGDSTQELSAGIRKLATGGGDRFCRKNTMPYFLARLEGLAGLRPFPSNDDEIPHHG
jgi:hypothetical protein